MLFIAFSLISRITLGAIRLVALKMGEESFYAGIPEIAINAVSLIGTVLIFSSFSTLFSYYDKYELHRFLNRGVAKIEAKTEFKDTVCSIDFILEASVLLVFSFFAALFGAYPEVGGSFFADGSHRDGPFPLLLLPVLLLILFVTKYEAKRYWYHLHKRHDLDALSTLRFIITLAVLIFLYPIIFPFAPLLGFMAITVFNIAVEISEALTVIGLILAITVATLLILTVFYLRAMSKRRSFLNRLREIAEKEGFEYDANWTTRQFGSKLIDFLNEKKGE